MIGKYIVRTILFLFTAFLPYAIWLTWSSAVLENNAQRLLATIVESSVLLVALSLLVESFRSFGTIFVQRNNFKHLLYYMAVRTTNDDSGNSIGSVRTCELFMIQSFVLSLVGLLTAAVIYLIYALGKFLFDPYFPVVDWGWIIKTMGMTISITVIATLWSTGHDLIYKTKKHIAIRVTILYFYWNVFLSASLTFLLFSGLLDKELVVSAPWYLVMPGVIGFMLFVTACLGIMIAVGLGLYTLVIKISKKIPMLNNIWNQVCPIQTIRLE